MNRRVAIGTTGIVLLAAAALLWHRTAPPELPDFAAVKSRYRLSEALLLDRDGHELQRLRMDYRARRLDWTPLAEISPALPDAVIAAEDRRFARHGGVDLLAVAGAVRDHLRGQSRRGASTLEMQLVAMLDPALKAGSGRRGVLEKLRQVRAARRLSRQWHKAEVMEAYLNLAGFHGESEGVAAASQALFLSLIHI